MADTIRTQAELLAIFADGQASNAITEQDLRDLIISMPAIQGNMWQHYEDSAFPVGGKRVILAGVRTKLTIDGVTRTEASPNGYSPIWNVSTNKIEPFAIDDFYTVRLDLKAWNNGATDNHFDIEMDIGGAVGVVAADTGVLIKGQTTSQNFNFSSQFFVGTTFLANGGEIYITPLGDASFWDAGITISRVYKAEV